MMGIMSDDSEETQVFKRKGRLKEKKDVSKVQEIDKNNNNNNFHLISLVRKTAEKEKLALVKKIEAEVDELTDQIVNAVESKNLMWHEGLNKGSDKRLKKCSDGGFHEKCFIARNSLLTDLFKVNHISTIYHIFIAFLINLFISTAVSDMIKLGKINLGLNLIYWNFQSLPLAGLIWLAMQSTTVVVYFFFNVWAKRRSRLFKRFAVRMWDAICLTTLIVYYVLFLVIPACIILQQRLAIAISFSVLMEQIRFLMKTYSFIRSTAPKVIKSGQEKLNSHLPSLGMYLYFLFAPTLVYRDEYPRTSRIRWKIVLQHFVEIVGVVFYLAFIMENYLIPSTKEFGKKEITVAELVVLFFNNNVPCVFVLLCGFYSFLHSWMNAFAEILRFADRMFYQDWWNSSSFAEYYKTWNVVVHDWLYAFVYKDGTEVLGKKKATSTWMVFIISALFHEYILALTFKFCYPVLFLVFGIIGTCFMFIPKKRSSPVGNMLLWLGIFVGTGCCGSLYMLEYYARINCHHPNNGLEPKKVMEATKEGQGKGVSTNGKRKVERTSPESRTLPRQNDGLRTKSGPGATGAESIMC